MDKDVVTNVSVAPFCVVVTFSWGEVGVGVEDMFGVGVAVVVSSPGSVLGSLVDDSVVTTGSLVCPAEGLGDSTVVVFKFS